MRVVGADPDNLRFIQWLRDISSSASENDLVELLLAIPRSNSPTELFDQIYPMQLLRQAVMDPTVFGDRAILTARNVIVTAINTIMIGRLPGPPKEYLSTNTA